MAKKGFTLIELMVTVTIMLIMTMVVLFNYNRFNESSLLSAFAYDMSLTIRQAQVYGVATKGSGNQGTPISYTNYGGGGSFSDTFKQAYGVHFAINNQASFLMFIDADNSGTFNSGDITLQTYTFQRGIKIRALCVDDNDPAPPNDCNTVVQGSIGKKVNATLDITFLRPNPEAKIKANNGASQTSSATIYLSNSDQTITKSVVIYSTGQISVQ